MLKVEDAKKELKEKSYDEIQVETAWKWASRAAASFENVISAPIGKKLSFFMAGQEYLHEAVEHASLAEDDGLVSAIKTDTFEYIAEAIEDIEMALDVDL
jgi:hypothetical protein